MNFKTVSFFLKGWKQAQKHNKCFIAVLFSFEKLSLNLAKLGFNTCRLLLFYFPFLHLIFFLFSSDKVLC